jgi:hypothetical protein
MHAFIYVFIYVTNEALKLEGITHRNFLWSGLVEDSHLKWGSTVLCIFQSTKREDNKTNSKPFTF